MSGNMGLDVIVEFALPASRLTWRIHDNVARHVVLLHVLRGTGQQGLALFGSRSAAITQYGHEDHAPRGIFVIDFAVGLEGLQALASFKGPPGGCG